MVNTAAAASAYTRHGIIYRADYGTTYRAGYRTTYRVGGRRAASCHEIDITDNAASERVDGFRVKGLVFSFVNPSVGM